VICACLAIVLHGLQLLLSRPLLLAEIVLLGAILVRSVGRPFGVPLLFWHEERGPQFLAGLASTLLIAQTLFVSGLSSGGGFCALEAIFIVGGTLWTLAVLWGAANRIMAKRQPGRNSPLIRGLTAPMGRIAHGELAEDTASLQVSPLPFVCGFAAAVLIVALLTWPLLRYGARLDPRVLVVASLLPVTAAYLLRRQATSAIVICSIFAVITAVDGFVTLWIGSPGVSILLLAVLLMWAGRELFPIRVPELGGLYGTPARYPPRRAPDVPLADADDLLADRLASEPVDERLRRGSSEKPEPLILVCVSGGGIRAASWTAGVLVRLAQAIPTFVERTWMITGASGGMVGAAAWVSNHSRRRQEPGTARLDFETIADADGLTAVARALAFDDIPRSILPVVNHANRGFELQRVWKDLDEQQGGTTAFAQTVAELRKGEEEGQWPSLVFSPMIVEDGRRFLISNLKLRTVTRAINDWVAVFPGGPAGQTPVSTSAFHAEEVLGEPWKHLSLGTAARLSASFPYVSPATVLPTRPRCRVVDAGYYDNYGVDIATSWLRKALEKNPRWLEANVSGVMVVQIRDGVRTARKEPARGKQMHLPPDDTSCVGRLMRALEGVTSPIAGLFAAREAGMDFRNDAQLEAVMEAFRRAHIPVATTIFELKGELALSWRLSSAERNALGEQLESNPIKKKIADVARWLEAGAPQAVIRGPGCDV
jgi:hypothetical protein